MSSEIISTLIFGILAFFLLYLAQQRAFFLLEGPPLLFPIRLSHVIGAFAVYFLINLISTKVFLYFFKSSFFSDYTFYSSLWSFTISSLSFVALFLYLFSLKREVKGNILLKGSFSFKEDLFTAVSAWVIAFPLVLFVNQIFELFLSSWLDLPSLPEQVAVKFLKMTFQQPFSFFLAVFSIVVLAPLVEETLFRGFFQSFIRQHLGSKQAILVTSVCFSFFHFSLNQGISNLSIIISLFILSLFLGFIYEKRGSLFAPILLHSFFNGVSVINLYLFEGYISGL